MHTEEEYQKLLKRYNNEKAKNKTLNDEIDFLEASLNWCEVEIGYLEDLLSNNSHK